MTLTPGPNRTDVPSDNGPALADGPRMVKWGDDLVIITIRSNSVPGLSCTSELSKQQEPGLPLRLG